MSELNDISDDLKAYSGYRSMMMLSNKDVVRIYVSYQL